MSQNINTCVMWGWFDPLFELWSFDKTSNKHESSLRRFLAICVWALTRIVISWNQTNVALPKEQCAVMIEKKLEKKEKSGGGKAHQVCVIAVINTDSLFNAPCKKVTD